MRQNKLAVILALGAFIVLNLSFALASQKKESEAAKEANGRFENMSEQLKLTPEQKPKVKAIVDQQMLQWTVLSQNKTLNGKQKIAKMQEINQDAQQKIEKILSPPQRQKLQTMMDAAKPQPARSHPNPKKRPPPSE